MNYVQFSWIMIWNWNFCVITAEFWSQDEFPTYPFYLHAQVRKELSTVHRPLSPAGPTNEMLVYKNQEVHEEKGYTDDTDNKQPWKQNGAEAKAEIVPKFFVDASPSKILAFAASELYDQAAHQNGIYAVRSRMYNCPALPGLNGDTDSDKSRDNAESKAKRAKAYMECIKRRYFGASPLPIQIFALPSESRQREIKMGSIAEFMNEFKTRFNR